MHATANLPTVTAPVSVYPPPWRWFAAVLVVVSRLSPPVLFGILHFGWPPLTEPLLFRLFVILFLLPAMAAGLVRRAFAFDLQVCADALEIRRGTNRFAFERGAVDTAKPWHLPLPGPGVTLRSADFTYAVQVDDPSPILRMLDDRIETEVRLPATVVYGQARSAVGRARWHHLVGKYGLFPLPIVLLLFRLHQYLVYGGTFGQYYTEGLQPYLSTLGYYWIVVVTNLVLYASVWRGGAEAASFLLAWAKPARALAVRRWAERVVQIAYYAGVPALLARRFLFAE